MSSLVSVNPNPEVVNKPLPKARARGLNRLAKVRRGLLMLRRLWLTKVWGMQIDPTAQISLSAKLDRTYPSGVVIGAHTLIAFEARILTHDMTRGLYVQTKIGRNCFVGGRSLILPGVEIGDNCVIGAGSVVTRSVPPRTLVAGNPARVVRSGINVGLYGRFTDADLREAAFAMAEAAVPEANP